MQSALGLNWTPWDDLVWSTQQAHVCSTNTLAYEPGDADEWRACCDTRESVIVPEDGCEVESRKEPDLIVGRPSPQRCWHQGGGCTDRGDFRNDGRRRARGGVGSDGRGSRTCRRPFQPGGLRGRRQADESLDGTEEDAVTRWRATGRNLPRSVDRSTGAATSAGPTVWLFPLDQPCGVRNGPDGAAPAGPATPPAVAAPTRAMPAPPSEACCVRSNSIHARW